MCSSLLVDSRSVRRKRKRGREPLRGCKAATVAGREILRASKCNCIFARDAIDRSIDQSAKSLALSRARAYAREERMRFVRCASPCATRRLAFGPLPSPGRKLWLGRSRYRISRRYQRTFMRRTEVSLANDSTRASRTSGISIFFTMDVVSWTTIRVIEIVLVIYLYSCTLEKKYRFLICGLKYVLN